MTYHSRRWQRAQGVRTSQWQHPEKSRSIRVTVDRDVWERIALEADRRELPIAAIVREILDEHLDTLRRMAQAIAGQ